MEHLKGFFSQFKIRWSDSGYHRMVNPLDTSKHYNMVVCFERNFVQDWKTGYNTSIPKFIQEITKCTYKEAVEFAGILEPTLSDKVYKDTLYTTGARFPEGTIPLDNPCGFALRARTYLLDRKLNVGKLVNDGWGVGAGNNVWFGRVIIPYKVSGRLSYYSGRSFIGGYPKYLNATASDVNIGKSELFYNQDALVKYSSGWLVEGVIDAETIGDNAIAASGWKLSDKQISLISNSAWKSLHIVPDTGFELKAIATGLYFKNKLSVFVHKIAAPFKDVNEAGVSNIIINETPL